MSINSSKSVPKCRPARIWKHWQFLCRQIGERRAGSRGETRAAQYILSEFGRLGLKAVHEEPFPCTTLLESKADFSFRNESRFESVPARALVGCPSTPGQTLREADLVWIEMPEQAGRLFQESVQGKIVMLFGPLPTHVEIHRRLVALGPLAVVHIDDRLPFSWLKDDGVYPVWAQRYGMPPTLTISYASAWKIKKLGCKRARLRLSVHQGESVSQNVLGEIPGRRPDLPLILLGAHHDTQCNNTGADDNASGVVALLELAALLGKKRFVRTIRFASFGVEEQLSVGSARYVSHHQAELSRIGMVFNFDAISSYLGHFQLYRAGSTEFGAAMTKELARHGLDVVEKTEVSPFGDHFPFSAFGIPAATLYRPNMDSGMRWQHHSRHDNLDEVSVAQAAKAIQAVAGLLCLLADKSTWPFKSGLPSQQQLHTKQLACDLYNLNPDEHQPASAL